MDILLRSEINVAGIFTNDNNTGGIHPVLLLVTPSDIVRATVRRAVSRGFHFTAERYEYKTFKMVNPKLQQPQG